MISAEFISTLFPDTITLWMFLNNTHYTWDSITIKESSLFTPFLDYPTPSPGDLSSPLSLSSLGHFRKMKTVHVEYIQLELQIYELNE